MGSYRNRALEEAIEVEVWNKFLVERELREGGEQKEAARSYSSRSRSVEEGPRKLFDFSVYSSKLSLVWFGLVRAAYPTYGTFFANLEVREFP